MTKSQPEKLSRIDEVNMLNLGLRKTKQETTALQIISFHQRPQCEKGKHRTPKGLRSPQHRKLRFYSPHHRGKKNTNTAILQMPMSPSWYSAAGTWFQKPKRWFSPLLGLSDFSSNWGSFQRRSYSIVSTKSSQTFKNIFLRMSLTRNKLQSFAGICNTKMKTLL